MSTIDSVARFVVATLLAGLWQAPLFSLAAFVVLRIASRANATTRHSVLAAALVASLGLPVATAALAFGHGAPAQRLSAVDDVAIPRGAISTRPADTRAVDGPRNSRNPRVVGAGPALAVPSFVVPSLGRASLALPPILVRAVVGLWLAGATIVLVRLIVSLMHLEALKRDALPLPVAYRAGLRRWSAVMKGSREVRLCVSDEIDIPIAVGLFDAMILVPKRLLDELAVEEIDSIVLHELAHLRRSDDWFNAAERLAHATLFFNPAILWLAGQLDLEREVACDDWVLQQDDALPYATCLAKVAETAAWPGRAMTAPGAFITRRAMSIRIERLLAKQRDVRIRTSLGPAGSTVAVLVGLGIVAALVSPSIAYTVTDREKRIATKDWHTSPRGIVREAHVTRPVIPYFEAPTPIAVAIPPSAAPHRRVDIAGVSIADASASHARAGASGTIADAADGVARASAGDVSRSGADVRSKARMRPRIVAEASDPDYVDELAGVGYTHLSLDELVELRSVGVTAAFVRDLEKHGVAHPSVGELVRLRALDISPQFVAAMRKRFGSSTDLGAINGLRALGVTPDYVDGLMAAGVRDLSPERVDSLRALDVSPSYLRDLARAGYPNLSVGDVQQLRAVGVDRAFIERARAHGFTHLSIDQLVRLEVTGVL